VRQRPAGPARNPAVRAKRVRTTAVEPPPQVGDVVKGIDQHLLVVTQERYQLAPPAQREEPVHDAAAARAPVDLVTQGDKRIFWAEPNGLDQGGQGIQAAVNVAKGYHAACHAPSAQPAPSHATSPLAGRGCSAAWSCLTHALRRPRPVPLCWARSRPLSSEFEPGPRRAAHLIPQPRLATG